MKVFALNSNNEEFDHLITQVSDLVEVKKQHEIETLILEMDDCIAVLLDLDTDRKSIEKAIKSIKKSDNPKTIMVLCNSLQGKDLQKHQGSRGAADIYLTSPMETEVLKMMMEEVMNSSSPDDSNTFVLDMDAQDELGISTSAQDDVSGSEEVESPDELDLSDDGGGDLDLSIGDEDIDESIDLSSNDELDLGGNDLDLSEDVDEEVVPEASQKIELNEEPISLDDDITMGGIDLSDLGESTKVAADDLGSLSLSDDDNISDDSQFDKTRPILQSELESIVDGDSNSDESFDLGGDLGSDEAFDLGGAPATEDAFSLNDDNDDGEIKEHTEFEFKLPEGDDVPEEEGDLSTIAFSLGDDDASGTDETQVAGGEEHEEEDDFQTKLREIDQMLKEDTSVALAVKEDDGSHDDSDPLPESPEVIGDGISDHGEPAYQSSVDFSESLTQDHKEYIAGHDNELVRLGETIKSLRLDREQLVQKVQHLEQQQNNKNDDILTMRAQLDEKKIENSIMKKRYSQQVEDLNLKLELVSDKKAVLEEKSKQFQKEFMDLRKEKKLDVNKVRSRERELEDKLELLRKDAEVQMRNRDHKILELKRRIDTLEFDVESAHLKERQSTSDQTILEGKMNKVISTLRTAISHLEDDSPTNERINKIKKNLDV